MYQCGQQIVYGSHGICNIVDIEEKLVDKKALQYYALEPLAQPGTRYYVPVHNEAAVSKMRPLLSREALNELLTSRDLDRDLWIADESRRKLQYRDLINRGNPRELIAMVRLLQLHRDEQLAAGRKFHICDANFLKDAENLLKSEITYVLGIEAQDVGLLIG